MVALLLHSLLVLAPSRPVAVDLSALSDRTIEQCKLRGFQGLLVQSLIEEHFAVVDTVDEDGINVAVQATPTSFELRASSKGAVLHDWLDIPKPCDSSIQLDLVQRITSMARTIDAKTGGAPRPRDIELITPPTPAPKGKTPEVPERPVYSRAPVEIDFQGVYPGHTPFLVGGSLRLNLDFRAFFLSIAPEVSLHHASDLWIYEPAMAIAISKAIGLSWPFAADIGLEVAPIAHVFSAPSDSGVRFDGRVGLPLAITGGRGRVTVTVMPYARLHRFEHFVDNLMTYTSERWGILLRVGVGL